MNATQKSEATGTDFGGSSIMKDPNKTQMTGQESSVHDGMNSTGALEKSISQDKKTK